MVSTNQHSTGYVMCKTLGKMGRLGNQMFQYALLLGVAKQTGLRPALPYKNKTPGNERTNMVIDDLFGIKVDDCSNLRAKTTILEPFDDISYLSSIATLTAAEGSIDFYGYFQSEKYFKHAEQEVRSAFVFADSRIRDHATESVETSRVRSDTGKVVAVHVRRGDYLKLPLIFPFSSAYYKRAMEHITESLGGKCHFIVVSDDIPWCKTYFPNMNRFGSFTYSEGTSPAQDLALIRATDHCIIANSSFSWWGAWLNETPGKIVTAPDPWFGPQGPKGHDLYAEGWIKC